MSNRVDRLINEVNALANSALAQVAPGTVRQLVAAAREYLESLPLTKPVEPRNNYFVLVGDKWLPVCGTENGRWLEWHTVTEYGEIEQGASQPREWAHLTADGTVNYHWFDDEATAATTATATATHNWQEEGF